MLCGGLPGSFQSYGKSSPKNRKREKWNERLKQMQFTFSDSTHTLVTHMSSQNAYVWEQSSHVGHGDMYSVRAWSKTETDAKRNLSHLSTRQIVTQQKCQYNIQDREMGENKQSN